MFATFLSIASTSSTTFISASYANRVIHFWAIQNTPFGSLGTELSEPNVYIWDFFFESSIEITFKRVRENDEDFFYQRNYIKKVRRNDVKILRNLVFNVFTKYPLQIDVNFTWSARWAGCCMWKYGVLVKVRESLLCVTNRRIKVTSKLILPSVSRFEFHPYYKSKVKLIFV